jgi:hypothetical protein
MHPHALWHTHMLATLADRERTSPKTAPAAVRTPAPGPAREVRLARRAA